MIYPGTYAFAAIMSTGKIHAWGRANCGGNDTGVNDQLQQYEKFLTIYSTSKAFAAITTNNRVISWGHPGFGGRTPNGVNDIQKMCANDVAFGAISTTGQLTTWGNSNWGGDVGAIATDQTIVECYPRYYYYYYYYYDYYDDYYDDDYYYYYYYYYYYLLTLKLQIQCC